MTRVIIDGGFEYPKPVVTTTQIVTLPVIVEVGASFPLQFPFQFS